MSRILPTRVAQTPVTMLFTLRNDDTMLHASGEVAAKAGNLRFMMGVLPAGARVIDASVHVDTAFNDSTIGYCGLGDDTSKLAFVSPFRIDLPNSVGRLAVGTNEGYMRLCTQDTPVFMWVSTLTGNSTVGALTAAITFVQDGKNGEMHPHGIDRKTITAFTAANSSGSSNSN